MLLNLQSTVCMLRKNKNRNMGMCYVKQIINMFRGWERKVEEVEGGGGYLKFG
jgi:hypothetical protein